MKIKVASWDHSSFLKLNFNAENTPVILCIYMFWFNGQYIAS